MAELREKYKVCVITHKKTRSICGYVKVRLERTIESVGASLLQLYSMPTQIFSNVAGNINCYKRNPFEVTDTKESFELEEVYSEEIISDVSI